MLYKVSHHTCQTLMFTLLLLLCSADQRVYQYPDVAKLQIQVSGDCHPNPGPNYRFPCKVCSLPVKSNQRGLACDNCDGWFHTKCINMPLRCIEVSHQMLVGFALPAASLTSPLHSLRQQWQTHWAHPLQR